MIGLKRLLIAVAILVPAGVLGWMVALRSAPPEVPFARVQRETLVSMVRTNGEVEPAAWQSVRAGQSGLVTAVSVEKGQPVERGALIARLDDQNARTALEAVEARIAQAQAELAVIESGGRRSEIIAIENDRASTALELGAAREELAALERLAAKQAVTEAEVKRSREAVQRLEARMVALERKRAELVSPADQRGAEARLRAAEADAAEARRRLEQAVVRSPIAGVVYRLDVREGAYVNAGDRIAEVGKLGQVRVVIYVDEPELGRVGIGMPVTITWDAMPGKRWTGQVEKTPTEIVSLGTRKVGEVIAVIDNEDGLLPPGASIDVEIESSVAKNVLTIPKEALRREAGEAGVFVLDGDTVAWRPVRIGVSSITRAEVLDGLTESDAVALPTEVVLADGAKVAPLLP